jgi:hypothetical protein
VLHAARLEVHCLLVLNINTIQQRTFAHLCRAQINPWSPAILQQRAVSDLLIAIPSPLANKRPQLNWAAGYPGSADNWSVMSCMWFVHWNSIPLAEHNTIMTVRSVNLSERDRFKIGFLCNNDIERKSSGWWNSNLWVKIANH